MQYGVEMSANPPAGNLPEDCHAMVRQTVEYWRKIAPDGQLPGRQHVDPVHLKHVLGNVWLVDVVRDPLRFRYRLAGTCIVDYLGHEPTGKWADKVIPHFWNTNTGRDLSIAANDGVARWRRGVPSIRRDLNYKTVEQVSLPLASNGTLVDIILNLTLFLDEEGSTV